MPNILYLARADIESLNVPMAQVMNLVEQALNEHGSRQIQMPPSTGVSPGGGAFVHAMPAYLPRLAAMGVKWVSIAPGNSVPGTDRITGVVVLNDPESTIPLSVMDCSWITAMRTGAVSGVAAKYLARKDSSRIGLIGAGVQGRTNVLALQESLPALQEVRVFDISEQALERYCQEMEPLLRVPLRPTRSAEEAVDGADVILTATPVRREPRSLVRDEWLRPGALGIPLELDSAWSHSTFSGVDKFLCDDLPQLQHAASGNFPIHFFAAGLPEVYAELGEVVAGRKPGRENKQERIITLNMGMGIHDVTVGRYLYDLARERGVGQTLPLS